MKHLKKITFIFLTFLLTACSSNDDSKTLEANFIQVGESSFEMKTAVVEPSLNSVFLSLTNNTEAEIIASFSGTTFNNVDYFSARINAFDLLTGETYNLDAISRVEFIVDGDVIDSEFENGFSQFYKSGSNSNLEVVAGSITVIDYAVDVISLSFSFTRSDGVEITGVYEGDYLYFD
ncbi:hypothetical protein PK35_00075 [Tamlana nanhaiensis]|uniref:Uncharacterized protein n=1 Tax=Neotamlana nanhaiensis TaxID=1382798 RepID=A0A0D7W5G4_9FLAO|nr:hypothetical protein [Tamlana nanhaiensis]KJD34264.1 hypothetical protein PK35_00075 [Tamlana nanhaiensis]